jgi:CheY-like chemotaxis protein
LVTAPASLYSTMPTRAFVPAQLPTPVSAAVAAAAPAPALASPPITAFGSTAMPPAVAAAVAAFEPISFLKPSQPLPVPAEPILPAPPALTSTARTKFPDLRTTVGLAPIAPAPPAPVAPTIVAEMPAADWVLVVDDNLTVREFMRSKLAPFNFNVDYAESGEQAVGLTGHRRYTCVFLDVVMPGIDGYQVCKLIKSKKSQGKTHVVMLTSKGSPFDKIRGAMAGCDAYLTKPVDEEKLLETIVRFLPNRV